MKTQELLVLAAKAAGYKALSGRVVGLEGKTSVSGGLLCDNDLYWNPIENDGDAFRLAVWLGIRVFSPDQDQYHLGQRQACAAAVRMSIVKAAAKLGAT